MTKRLEGKIALITGAAMGIGKAIALLFAEEGAKVVVSDIDDAAGEKTLKEIGPNATYLHLDVSQETEWERVIKEVVNKHGALDILVNNAGIVGLGEEFGPQDPEHASLESWKRVHAINADSVFLGCKYAIGAMKKRPSASIINLSSRSGVVGIPGAAAYASSKASIRNHTKSVALYSCQEGYHIRCNSIQPAAILTPMWDAMLGTGPGRKEALKQIEGGIPMRKMGDPEDVAYAALYLASDESKYVTGAEFTIDGGILAGAASAPGKSEKA